MYGGKFYKFKITHTIQYKRHSLHSKLLPYLMSPHSLSTGTNGILLPIPFPLNTINQLSHKHTCTLHQIISNNPHQHKNRISSRGKKKALSQSYEKCTHTESYTTNKTAVRSGGKKHPPNGCNSLCLTVIIETRDLSTS